MSTKLKFTPSPENLEEIFQNAATLLKPLGDHGPVDLVKAEGRASVDYQGQAPAGTFKFGLGVEGNASIGVLNAANDEDKDGVYSGQPVPVTVRETASGEFQEVKLEPALRFNNNGDVWTKYRFEGKPLVTADIDFPLGFTIKLDGSKTAVFGDYHRHQGAEKTLDALRADLGSLRFAADADDVVELSQGDALFYNVRGVLETTMSFKWADSFAFALSDLSSLLGKGQSLSLEVGLSAAVDFQIALHDDFRLVFTKHSDGRVKVAVLKSDSQELGVKLDAGLKVGFANPDQLTEALNKLYLSLVGKQLSLIEDVIGKIDKAVKKLTFNELTAREKEIISLLAERFGLAPALASLDELAARWEQVKTKWMEVKDTVPGIIKKAVNTKIGLGFKYEYLRMKNGEELAVALLNAESLKRVHTDLIMLRLESFLAESQLADNDLISYINQKTLLKRQSWGFTLNVGKWTILNSEDKREVTAVIQKNIEGHRRVAFDALRSYATRFLPEKNTWSVNLKAESNNFSERLDYRTLEYGLHFKYYTLEKEIDAEELRNGLDYGMLWDSLTVQELHSKIDELSSAIGTRGQITAEFTIGDKELRRIAAIVKNLSEDELESRMAAAFAKALPYVKDLKQFRVTPANRLNTYKSLWKWCFDNPDAGMSELRNVIFNTLDNLDLGLAQMERMAPNMVHFAQQVERNNFNEARKGFLKGMKKLFRLFNEETSTDWDRDEFVSAFKSLRDMWDRELYVRAAGTFLLDIARKDSEIYSEIKRVMTITFTEDEIAKSILIGANPSN